MKRSNNEKLKKRSHQVIGSLDSSLQRSATLARERGGSAWLSVMPIQEHGFALNKGEFRDAICLRYGWRPSHPPSHCSCGHSLDVEHALSCKHGGFPIKRHNEIRDITASWMDVVCTGVGVEPPLQQLDNEIH